MKTSNISVLLNTRDGKKHYNGRGVVTFPFIVHRPIKSQEEMTMGGSHWCITHMASGRQAFSAATLKDAKRMIEILGDFDLFLMPESDLFLKLCREQGGIIKDALKNGGFSFNNWRFRDV